MTTPSSKETKSDNLTDNESSGIEPEHTHSAPLDSVPAEDLALSPRVYPPRREWTNYNPPFLKRYFYHEDYRLVTRAKIGDPATFATVIQLYFKYRNQGGLSPDHDIFFVPDNEMGYLANHARHVIEKSTDPSLKLPDAGQYWKLFYDHPSHRPLFASAEVEAIDALHEAHAQHLCMQTRAKTPFSMQEIQGFFEFLNSFPKEEQTAPLGISKAMVVSCILANYHEHKQNRPLASVEEPKTFLSKLLDSFLLVACYGIPPDYDERFKAARKRYEVTFQPETWESFIDQLVGERSGMNVVASLLLSSSVSFIAAPNTVDIAQCFTIICSGLSLVCVAIGLNPKTSKALEELRRIRHPIDSKDKLAETSMARLLNQHAILLMFSVVSFFLALIAYAAWGIYYSVFVGKSYTVRFLFYSVALSSLLAVAVLGYLWNRDRRDGKAKDIERQRSNRTQP